MGCICYVWLSVYVLSNKAFPVSGISVSEMTILIVDDNAANAENLRELIEFMDNPSVITAAPDDWKQRLGDRRLGALFVGPDLSERQLAGLLEELRELDSTVPVVMCEDQRP